MELKNADRPGWAQMTTGLPMDRRPDPQLPQDFWSALLDRVNGVIGRDLLDRLATADRFHGDPGLELGTVGTAFGHGWGPFSGVVPRLRG
jgi:hypothetical protein